MDYQYELLWRRQQELLNEVERAGNALKEAEAARNAMMQNNQPAQQHDVAQLESRIEQLRVEKEEAIKQVSELQFEAIKTNPDYARWLEEKMPPRESILEQKLELAQEIVESVQEHLPTIIENIPLIDMLPEGMPRQTAEVMKEAWERREEIQILTEVLIDKTVQNAKDFVVEKLEDRMDVHEKKELESREEVINEKYDKQLKETEKSYQKQLAYIENKYTDAVEREDKQRALTETIEKVKIQIENDWKKELQEIELEKQRLKELQDSRNGRT